MRLAILKLVLIVFLFSCKAQRASNEIVIEGNVTNVPDGRIYLSEAHYSEKPLYWAECKGGHFLFKITPDSSFVPFMASIHIADSLKPSKKGTLLLRNYMLGADSSKNFQSAFYLEKGYTRIEGDNRKPAFLRVFAGRENDVFYKNQREDFGWLGNLDSVNRLKRINAFKEEIKQHPFSFFLLQSIYENKEQYGENELKEILSLFNKDVQASKVGEQIKNYLANRTDPNQPLPNLLLTNKASQQVHIIDSSSKLTMLIFWASWCGPCRMEIPVLKEIEKEYKNKGLRFVNISIDDNKDSWLKAVEQEKMPWEQVIVDEAKHEEVMQQFNFRSIPLIVFVDKSGREIQRFVGYDKDGKKHYANLIQKFINQPQAAHL